MAFKFHTEFADSDYLRTLRNERRKARNTERTDARRATRDAVADHYAGI